MVREYKPPSPFLKAIIAESISLSRGDHAETNLSRLIELTRDEDRANRDWAAFLLAQEDADTPAVRAALLRAANDEDDCVRAEAVLGLARRDAQLALPLVHEALLARMVALPIFEAAALCAHPSLVAALLPWVEPSDNALADELAVEALSACEAAIR